LRLSIEAPAKAGAFECAAGRRVKSGECSKPRPDCLEPGVTDWDILVQRIASQHWAHARLLACEQKPMSTYYALVSSLIFAAVAAAHLLRLLNRWVVQVGPYSVPMSVSWVGLALAVLITAWGFAQLAQ
jgi:hypothetical protein